MPKVCSICRHPKRMDIEMDIERGVNISRVAKKHGVSYATLYQHCFNKHTLSIPMARDAFKTMIKSDDLVHKLEFLTNKAKELFSLGNVIEEPQVKELVESLDSIIKLIVNQSSIAIENKIVFKMKMRPRRTEAKLTKTELARFIEKINILDKKACWEWKGITDSKGYGKFRFGGKYIWAAHRLAYAIFHDKTIHPELEICHTCDNPPCVNPYHLYEGTRLQNAQDITRRKHGLCNRPSNNTHPLRKKRMTELGIDYFGPF